MKKRLACNITDYIIIAVASIILVYLLISLYFVSHTFFRTSLNGVDVSLKAYDKLDDTIDNFTKDYQLQLIERYGETEIIKGQQIELKYNKETNIFKACTKKNPIKWIKSLLWEQKYNAEDLFVYNKELLEIGINELKCLNKGVIEPQNVSFRYSSGSYEKVKEIYGNKINKDKLREALDMAILKGMTSFDLDEYDCYENPKYTLKSSETIETKKILDKYVSSKVTYLFRDDKETLDGNIISQWLSVDEKLGVVIDEKSVKEYVQELAKKYNTVGKSRMFRTSMNKMIEVKEGFYGWRISNATEIKVLTDNIKCGTIIEREPVYAQKAFARGKDDIGNTYLEINITRQHVWFYKNGKLIASGAVVTGNPNKGNATDVGVYMLNYKEKGSVLRGSNYRAEVSYWMPFNGNIGLHDASWRHSFGGSIYKTNGTHGCVNAPLSLAKRIFENIEDGTAIICYEE